MSQDTFLVLAALLIAVPFIVACIKGDPMPGLVTGFGNFLAMSFTLGQGTPPVGVLALGLIIAGFGIAWSMNRDPW